MAKFEKCPRCGAWRLQGELANHIGSCIMYSKPKEAEQGGNIMTKNYCYSMGERHAQWELKLTIYKNHSNYKLVLSDVDDDTYIATNYITANMAKELEELINNILMHSEGMENINDVLRELQKYTYGNMFYNRLKVAPQLTDGVILLAQTDAKN